MLKLKYYQEIHGLVVEKQVTEVGGKCTTPYLRSWCLGFLFFYHELAIFYGMFELLFLTDILESYLKYFRSRPLGFFFITITQIRIDDIFLKKKNVDNIQAMA